MAMAGQPAADDGAGTPDSAHAVDVDHPALRDVVVDGVQGCGGQFRGLWHPPVDDGEALVGLRFQPLGVGE